MGALFRCGLKGLVRSFDWFWASDPPRSTSVWDFALLISVSVRISPVSLIGWIDGWVWSEPYDDFGGLKSDEGSKTSSTCVRGLSRDSLFLFVFEHK